MPYLQNCAITSTRTNPAEVIEKRRSGKKSTALAYRKHGVETQVTNMET
jgi:hypothetical protein